jgi:predicted membrane chloride channel (bestrophin family)
MVMSGGNKNLIVTILAIIGAVVVAGWILKITFNLLGPLLLIGVAVLIYLMFFKKGPR